MNELEYFYCRNGKVAKDLAELADILQDMSDDEFSHHVSEFKNDFSTWILHVLKNAELSEKIRTCTAKEEMLLILNEEIMRKNISEKFKAFKEKEDYADEHELLKDDDIPVESTGLNMDTIIPKEDEDPLLTSIWLGGEKSLLKPVDIEQEHQAPLLSSGEMTQAQEQASLALLSNPKTSESKSESLDMKKEVKLSSREEQEGDVRQKENILSKPLPKEFTLKEFIFGIFLGFVLGFVIAKLLFSMVLK